MKAVCTFGSRGRSAAPLILFSGAARAGLVSAGGGGSLCWLGIGFCSGFRREAEIQDQGVDGNADHYEPDEHQCDALPGTEPAGGKEPYQRGGPDHYPQHPVPGALYLFHEIDFYQATISRSIQPVCLGHIKRMRFGASRVESKRVVLDPSSSYSVS